MKSITEIIIGFVTIVIVTVAIIGMIPPTDDHHHERTGANVYMSERYVPESEVEEGTEIFIKLNHDEVKVLNSYLQNNWTIVHFEIDGDRMSNVVLIKKGRKF